MSVPIGGAGFVLCSLAELCLAVPQADVVTIEHATEFSLPDHAESAIAWFDSLHGPRPVCALDSQLHPCPALHASGSFLVFLKYHPLPMALRCESVRILRACSELDVHPLPTAMQSGGGEIVRGVARIDRFHLAIVLGESKLPDYLAQIVTREASRE